MPSFGGFPIFGTAVSMTTIESPRSIQTNAYFGLDGVEVLDGGSRGRSTLASGLLVGTSAAALAAAEASFRALADGAVRVLVDTSGTTWPDVRLDSFQPQGKARRSSVGLFYRPYRARFFHLA